MDLYIERREMFILKTKRYMHGFVYRKEGNVYPEDVLVLKTQKAAL